MLSDQVNMGNQNTKFSDTSKQEDCQCYNCVLQASGLQSEPRLSVDSRHGHIELEICSRQNRIVIGKVVSCAKAANKSTANKTVNVTSSDVGPKPVKRDPGCSKTTKPAKVVPPRGPRVLQPGMLLLYCYKYTNFYFRL